MKASLTGLTPVTIAVAGALALSACPEQKQPAQAKPPTAPASGPAATPPPARTPTTAPSTAPSGALERGVTPETRDEVDPDGVLRRGLALSTHKTLSVGECLGSATSLAGSTVKVAGRIESVCRNKGCWFIIQGASPEERIRVTAKDYKFFVPSTVVGKTAVVEGALSTRTLSAEEVRHLEHESGEPALEGSAPAREIAIAAIALEVPGRS